ncbi:DUF680 domain-containing protein [Mesorhizobium sp. LHD-90]|uniref:DUF680 domain-containing protein n=1 Tax=Mesorhizobium sp. LHD-90 TaxID=3071414 RepID=UPI0027E1F778|nr:DUF680 domain-containing protein [Mesorhizobium sp. LHD-90]MDQ6437772.1 DUF680 domain-containing protein [Mesorhizobium sp. LHD-90]
MKKLVFALGMTLAVSAPAMAASTAKKEPAPAARVEKPVKKPVLDQIRTHSIAPATATGNATPAPHRQRSGIEVNPWIVPNFR